MKKLGDLESREIFELLMGKSHSNSEILKLLHLSTTSGYRKINNLIHDGFLIKSKSKIVESRRSVDLYVTFCNKLFIELQHKKLIIKVIVPKKYMESSSVFKSLLSFT
jgi:predicted transcriptional regulator